MKLKDIYNNPIINKAEFAAKMYPHLEKRAAASKLYSKITENTGQRVLPVDEKIAAKVWTELLKEINSK